MKFAPKFLSSWNIVYIVFNVYKEDTYYQGGLKTLINDDFE